MASAGYIYFLSNPSIPGLLKIGHTTSSVEERARQLSTTGIPAPFSIAASFYVADSAACERAIHGALENFRATQNREFFRTDLDVVLPLIVSVILPFLPKNGVRSAQASNGSAVAGFDIYAMNYLAYDAYENGHLISTFDIFDGQSEFSILEVEKKMIDLEFLGYVKRKEHPNNGMGLWRLTPKGLKFMFDGGWISQDILDDGRRR